MKQSAQPALPMAVATPPPIISSQNGQNSPKKNEPGLQSQPLKLDPPLYSEFRAPQAPHMPVNSLTIRSETQTSSSGPVFATRLDNDHESSFTAKPSRLNGNSVSPSLRDPSIPLPKNFGTPQSDHGENSPLPSGGSGAVARTGRVIERLGIELDKAKKEISLLSAKLDEEQQRSESSKLSLESLKISASQYETMYDQAQKTIIRKDRKLEDVRAELKSERERRIKAEKEKDESAQLVARTTQQSQRALAKEKEVAMHADAQYEALKGLVKKNERNFEAEILKMQSTLDHLRQRRQENSASLEHLESISQEIQQKQVLVEQAYQAVRSTFELYKSERDQSAQSIKQRAQENEDLGDALTAEMKEVLGKLRYVFNLRDFVG